MSQVVADTPQSALGAIDPVAIRQEIGKRKVELGLLQRLLKVAEARVRLAPCMPTRIITPSTVATHARG